MKKVSSMLVALLLLFYTASPVMATETEDDFVLVCNDIEVDDNVTEQQETISDRDKCEKPAEVDACSSPSIDLDSEGTLVEDDNIDNEEEVKISETDEGKEKRLSEFEEINEDSSQEEVITEDVCIEHHESSDDEKKEEADEIVVTEDDNEVIEKVEVSLPHQPTIPVKLTADSVAEVEKAESESILEKDDTLAEAEKVELDPVKEPSEEKFVEGEDLVEVVSAESDESVDDKVTTASTGSDPMIDTEIKIETISSSGVKKSSNSSNTNGNASNRNNSSNNSSTKPNTNSNTNTNTNTKNNSSNNSSVQNGVNNNTNTNNTTSKRPSYSNQNSGNASANGSQLNRLPKTGGLMDQSRVIWLSVFLILSGVAIRLTARKRYQN